ncbi:hypothetical protein JYK21_08835 [Ralstonia pickettii]|nr:hypothetical protein [Ralstonia pickettii]
MKKAFYILIGGLLAGISIWLFIVNSSVNELRNDVERKQILVSEIEEQLEGVAVQADTEEQVQVVKENVISVKQIGEEMIEVDNTLAAFYKTWDPPLEDEKVLQEVEAAKKKNTELTGADDNDHLVTWQLNPEWTLTLETVINYGDVKEIPVLFTMATGEGEFAGIVRAIYEVSEHELREIIVQYTPAGEMDRVL